LLDNKTLQVVPLGGLGEIGKNMTAVRQGSGIILVDAGLSFPDEEMPGIDWSCRTSLPAQHSDELEGDRAHRTVHEDHVGALPYMLARVQRAGLRTSLRSGWCAASCQEFGIKKGTCARSRPGHQNLGGFGSSSINVNHSIPDAVA
jgi:ribonuclease J